MNKFFFINLYLNSLLVHLNYLVSSIFCILFEGDVLFSILVQVELIHCHWAFFGRTFWYHFTFLSCFKGHKDTLTPQHFTTLDFLPLRGKSLLAHNDLVVFASIWDRMVGTEAQTKSTASFNIGLGRSNEKMSKNCPISKIWYNEYVTWFPRLTAKYSNYTITFAEKCQAISSAHNWKF